MHLPTPRHIATTLATLLAAALIAGCTATDPGGQPTTPNPPAPATTATAPNPVDLVRKAGAVPPDGADVGTSDILGWRVASGEFDPAADASEQITVRTFVDGGAADPSYATLSDDTTWYIRGEDFVAELTGILMGDTSAVVFPVTPEVVAARLGGKVVPRG